MKFSHLHSHTQFSLLDGAANIKSIIKKAAKEQMPAIAITDHGNMFGVPTFVNEAQKNGVKPIIGCEFYVTPVTMSDRENKERYHQVLLAKNMVGYRNLVKLCSMGYTEGLYYKPRIDKDVLRAHSEGLIATTCCLASEVNQTLVKEGEDAAREIFEWYIDVFGEDYYIELQRHGLRDQDLCNNVLLKWAKEYKVKVIATNDSHYVEKEDSEAHDVLLALQTNADLNDPNRFRFTDDYNQLNPEFYLKTPDEMAALFHDVPESIDNTGEIADKVENFSINSDLLLPSFRVPAGFGDMDNYLRHLTYDGARKRYGELSSEVTERIEMELSIINKMGYAGYFLIVQGFTTEARNRGVFVGPGRGSAAGSIVAYCTGIINIDPLRYGLLFERFLNPERVSPPDIDIDFDDVGRQTVIDYVVETYGRENVAQIVTYGTMKAKTAIRDVGRAMGIPLSEVNRITKLFPEKVGVDTFETVLDPDKNPETCEEIKLLFVSHDPMVRKMMQFAKTLEGSARQTSIHAAGVIIAPGPVSEYVPVALSKEKDIITQYDGPMSEMCGLLKMDFLGLRTLSILKTAIKYVEENHGRHIDLDQIPLDDQTTFELYQRGDTVATFQFESDGMRKYLKELKPTNIDDLIAMNALYRPGPMQFIPQYIDCKHGRKPVEFPDPMLTEVLAPTFGIMVYQEQIMQVAQIMGGYTLGEADVLRRAMGKKKVEEMEKQRAIFTERAKSREVDEKVAVEVFDKMAFFAGYGFNKSHSAAYSVLAYQTAYFKANYTAEYMSSVLTHNMSDIKKVSQFIEECRYLGILVQPPSVNTGAGQFVVRDGSIQYGLEAVKGVGSNAVEHLVKERSERGVFLSLFDFVSRMDLRNCNRKTLESLIEAGAFDCLNPSRAVLWESLDDALTYAQRKQADVGLNQFSLFGGDGALGADLQEPKLKDARPWTNMEKLKKERELIGFYLSGHPLDKFRDDIELFCTHNLNAESLGSLSDRTHTTVAGIISSMKRVTDKKGRPFAFFTLEDEYGTAEIIAFSNTFDQYMNLIMPDTLVVIEGSVDTRSGVPKIIANSIDRIENLREKNQTKIQLRLKLYTEELSNDDLRSIADLFENNRGKTPVAFDVISPNNPRLKMRARNFTIDPAEKLVRDLRAIVGVDKVSFEKIEL